MSILQRLWRDLTGRGLQTPASASPVLPPRAPAVPPVPAVSSGGPPTRIDSLAATRASMVERVLGQCAGSHAVSASKVFAASSYRPVDSNDAAGLVAEVVGPILEACIRKGDASTGCEVERIAYDRCIKIFELPQHYEACFAVLDPLMARLGAESPAAAAFVDRASLSTKRLLFFVHNATTEMAHIPLLCDVLESYLGTRPEDAAAIGIGGWCTGGVYAPRLQRLAETYGVSLLATVNPQSSRAAYDGAAQLVKDGHFDRIVVVAAPTGISYLAGALGPGRVVWYSMKFELNSFAGLEDRCSFIAAAAPPTRSASAKPWRRAPPFFAGTVELKPSADLLPALEQARTFATIFYTVNREHKIRNPVYLDAVSRVLDSVPGSCFVWTGHERLADVDAFFEQRGLLARTLFAGWVNPDDLVASGGIFLDTPVLSGTVAARASVLGYPVVTWAQSQSWINAFVPIFHADTAAGRAPASVVGAAAALADDEVALECSTVEQYVAQSIRLAHDVPLRERYGKALKSFAEHYFYDRHRWSAHHLENLRAAY